MAFMEGYLIGLAMVVFIGPVLFVLIGATLSQGRAAGLAVALGIFASDVSAAAIVGLGFSRIVLNQRIAPWIGFAGGLLLLGLGLRYILRSPNARPGGRPHLASKGRVGAFVSGFLVNFVNPFVFMVWVTVTATAGTRHGSAEGVFFFLTGAVLGVLTFDVLKVLFADRIQRLLDPKMLRLGFRTAGILMCLFGVRLFVSGITMPF